MLPFVGVDGEGGDFATDSGTDHRYTMLRAGDEYVTDNFLWFLATRPKKRLYVSYFFDYDVTMMCRDLPEEIVRGLVTSQPVRYRRFEMSYRPRKEFSVRAFGVPSPHNGQTIINDVGTFFQSSFVTALSRWNVGTDEERKMIADGKERRAAFGTLDDDTIRYNELECKLLVELMEKFRRVCVTIGYMPRRWQGPGQLAKAMLAAHNVPRTKDLPEIRLAGVWEAAQAAYYGGRFETSAVGPVCPRGGVDGWDINSAYPAAIATLPCLQHLEWRTSKRAELTVKDTGIYRVNYTHPAGRYWHGFPHRTKEGRILYPRTGSGWYWGVEILAAQKLGARIEVLNGFEYVAGCDHRLFDFVHRLFSVRKAVGKSEAGIALKLALNSLYGVFAQSVGDPPYANPIYAGLITAKTRATLMEAVSHDPQSVFMLATDGIYAAPGLPLTPSKELGGWDYKHYPDGMHIVMPGIYFANDGAVTRTRGIPGRVVEKYRSEITDAYHRNPDDGITVPLRQFISLRLAVARNNLSTAGQWLETEKNIRYDWTTKRQAGVHSVLGIDRTIPYTDAPEPESTPYDRFIGGNLAREMDRLEFLDVPDWGDTLTERQ